MADIPTLTAIQPTVSEGRAADVVVGRLEAMIVSGELPNGKPLPAERRLMAQFGVSRTVVREAIKALAGKGLVVARPRFRPVVSRPDYDTAFGVLEGIVRHLISQKGGVRHLFDSRILLESALVRMAAIEAGKTDISNLRDALSRNEAAISDSDAFYDTDIAFHGVLYSVPRNPVFPAVHKAYATWLSVHWTQMPRQPERNRRNFLAHREIFEAILSRDPDAAEEALRRHLVDAWSQVSATFGDL